MYSCGDYLRSTVVDAGGKLRSISEDIASQPGAPGKWSPKQIIGHLIDSASNNHQRFVRAQFQNHLRFDGYDQNAWVSAQGYQQANWLELVGLWEALNLHLARVMEATPAEILLKEHLDHNFDQVAWEVVSPRMPATLEYFMRDYIGHLKHHLRQIDPVLTTPPEKQNAGATFKRS